MARKKNQKNINAISISSYDKLNDKVDSRYVNLKIIDDNKFIFFSNYSSPKSLQFSQCKNIAALIFWNSINIQIRIQAEIKRTPVEFNQEIFSERMHEKNALAISSMQSMPIKSFDEVIKNFNYTFKNDDLSKCPDYWGGFEFIPNTIEFWKGDNFRLNRRNLFKKKEGIWEEFFLQP